jgi:hypothetical protein
VAAVPLLGGFAAHQRSQARRGGEPLVPPDLLKHLAGSQAVLFCVNTGVGVFFVLTLHLQLGLGFSPWEAAVTFAPSTFGIVVGNVLSMRLAPALGRGLTAAAVAVLLAGLVAIAVLVLWLGSALSGWALLAPVIGVGLGLGAALNSLFGDRDRAVRHGVLHPARRRVRVRDGGGARGQRGRARGGARTHPSVRQSQAAG